MKRIILSTCAMGAMLAAQAQIPEDALRYSWLPAGGTARVQALGGASGAVGGEISTLFSNPANLGFYKTGDAVITGGFNANRNTGTYLGMKDATQNHTSGFLGTSGIVMGHQNYRGGNKVSSAFGIGINRAADFNNTIKYKGLNKNSSIADMFIQDVQANQGYDQFGSDLAFSTYWIDTAHTNGGVQFLSPVDNALEKGTGLMQEKTIKTKGGITEIALAGGANFGNKIYFGGGIGIPVLRYEQTRMYGESAGNDPYFQNAQFYDWLVTKGIGLNAKLGFVFTPVQAVRIGISAQSPTFYSMSDSYTAAAHTMLGASYPTLDGKREYTVSATDLGKTSDYNNDGYSVKNYSQQSPYKLTGSLAFMLGNLNDVRSQRGFITADVDYVNYASSRFKLQNEDGSYDREYYQDLNGSMKYNYKGAVNARLGAELKFNTFMARVGGAYYGNPYKGLAEAKGSIKQLTGGFGYRNNGFFIDLGYVHTFQDDVNYPYRTEKPIPFYGANIKSSNSRLLLTLGIKI